MRSMPHLCRQDGLNQGQPLLPAVAQQLLKVGKCPRLRFSKCGAQGSGKKGTSAAHAARVGQGRLKTDCMDQPLQQAWGLIAALRLARLPPPELGPPPLPDLHYPTCSMPTALEKEAPMDCSCSPAWELRKWPASAESACTPGSADSRPGPGVGRNISNRTWSYAQTLHSKAQRTHPWCSSWGKGNKCLPGSPAGAPPSRPLAVLVRWAHCTAGEREASNGQLKPGFALIIMV